MGVGRIGQPGYVAVNTAPAAATSTAAVDAIKQARVACDAYLEKRKAGAPAPELQVAYDTFRTAFDAAQKAIKEAGQSKVVEDQIDAAKATQNFPDMLRLHAEPPIAQPPAPPGPPAPEAAPVIQQVPLPAPQTSLSQLTNSHRSFFTRLITNSGVAGVTIEASGEVKKDNQIVANLSDGLSAEEWKAISGQEFSAAFISLVDKGSDLNGTADQIISLDEAAKMEEILTWYSQFAPAGDTTKTDWAFRAYTTSSNFSAVDRAEFAKAQSKGAELILGTETKITHQDLIAKLNDTNFTAIEAGKKQVLLELAKKYAAGKTEFTADDIKIILGQLYLAAVVSAGERVSLFGLTPDNAGKLGTLAANQITETEVPTWLSQVPVVPSAPAGTPQAPPAAGPTLPPAPASIGTGNSFNGKLVGQTLGVDESKVTDLASAGRAYQQTMLAAAIHRDAVKSNAAFTPADTQSIFAWMGSGGQAALTANAQQYVNSKIGTLAPLTDEELLQLYKAQGAIFPEAAAATALPAAEADVTIQMNGDTRKIKGSKLRESLTKMGTALQQMNKFSAELDSVSMDGLTLDMSGCGSLLKCVAAYAQAQKGTVTTTLTDGDIQNIKAAADKYNWYPRLALIYKKMGKETDSTAVLTELDAHLAQSLTALGTDATKYGDKANIAGAYLMMQVVGGDAAYLGKAIQIYDAIWPQIDVLAKKFIANPADMPRDELVLMQAYLGAHREIRAFGDQQTAKIKATGLKDALAAWSKKVEPVAKQVTDRMNVLRGTPS